MTRVKISGGILLLLIIISIFSSVWINRRCNAMLVTVSEISRTVGKGRNDEASECAKRLNADWESFREGASVLLKNDKLTEIDRLYSRIVYLAENEEDEMAAELAELRDMLEMLKSSETPLLTSVF